MYIAGNAVCLAIVAVLLGYGLVEFPRALFQSARAEKAVRKAEGIAIDNHSQYHQAASEMAKMMCKVFGSVPIASLLPLPVLVCSGCF